MKILRNEAGFIVIYLLEVIETQYNRNVSNWLNQKIILCYIVMKKKIVESVDGSTITLSLQYTEYICDR